MSKTTLILYQHSYSARDRDPDGAAYGTTEEAHKAEADAARSLIESYSGEDIAEALTEGADADDFTPERLEVIRGLGDEEEVDTDKLTDAEAISAAEALRGYETAVYPIHIEFDTRDLLGAIAGDESPSVRALLENGVVLASRVYSRWESGDLAGAVGALNEWTDDVKAAFPALDYSDGEDDEDETPAEGEGFFVLGRVSDADRLEVLTPAQVRPGDLVDLEPWTTENDSSQIAAQSEYARVCGVEQETPDCIRLDFDNFPSWGFDVASKLSVTVNDEARERYADRDACPVKLFP